MPETQKLRATAQKPPDKATLVIQRSPITYAPWSTTSVNKERLPPLESLSDMDLAYRQQFLDDDDVRRAAAAHLLGVFAISMGFAALSVVVAPRMPIGLGFGIAGVMSLMLCGRFIIGRTGTVSRFALAIFAPCSGLLIVKLMGHIAAHRTWATIILSIVTLVMFLIHGERPLTFYRTWIYAHPRLRPQTRRHMEEIAMHPRVGILALILLIAVFVPMLSPALAIVAVISVCVAAVRKDLFRFKTFVHQFLSVCGQYVTYGKSEVFAPGVWMPAQGIRVRRRSLWKMIVPLFLALTIGLHMFCPWDVLKGSIEDDYRAGWEANQALRNWYWGSSEPQSPPAFDDTALYATPYEWVDYVHDGVHEGRPGYFAVLIIAGFLFYLLPVLVLVTLYGRSVQATYELCERVENTLDVDDRPEWQWYVDRLRSSQHEQTDPVTGRRIQEGEHLFAGVEPNAQFPVLLHESILSEHCYIVGETGSGKTSLGIMPILIQLLRGRADDKGVTTPPPPIVVLDLKGDPALFHCVRTEVERRRQQAGISDQCDPRYAFRFFTPEKDRASHFFNPFQSLESGARSDIQLCHLFLDALNLNHGEGYGRSYYSRRNRMLLFDALHMDPKPKSILELCERLGRLTKGKRDPERLIGEYEHQHDAFELVSTIQALAQYPMLATAANVEHPEEAINMPELIEHRQVAYFWLPAALESISVREIGKLALFALLTAAIDRQRSNVEPRQVHLVIDEFQRIAGENFKVILEQARSFGISAILANQTQSDLKTHDVDLRSAVQANTRAKMYFALSDIQEIKELSEISGEELAVLQALDKLMQPVPERDKRAWVEWLKPRLTRNDILRASDHPFEYLLRVSRGEGYSQFAGLPLVCRTSYPVTRERYNAFQRAAWPEGRVHTTVSHKTPREHDAAIKAEAQKNLAALFAELEQ